MRKLAVMAALLLGGTAVADDKGSTGEETKEAGQAAARDTKEAAEDAKDWSKEQGQRAEDSTERATQDAQSRTNPAGGPSPASSGTASSAQANENARDRMEKDSFDLDGKISKASAKQLTIQREDAPAATLHIDSMTKIELDGERVSASQLKPGQDVKASFNLKGDKAHAVEIKAEKQK